MIFKSNKEKYFSKIEAIDLMVSLSATDANSEKKWRGFYNSLSKTELEEEWDVLERLIQSNKLLVE